MEKNHMLSFSDNCSCFFLFFFFKILEIQSHDM